MLDREREREREQVCDFSSEVPVWNPSNTLGKLGSNILECLALSFASRYSYSRVAFVSVSVSEKCASRELRTRFPFGLNGPSCLFDATINLHLLRYETIRGDDNSDNLSLFTFITWQRLVAVLTARDDSIHKWKNWKRVDDGWLCTTLVYMKTREKRDERCATLFMLSYMLCVCECACSQIRF